MSQIEKTDELQISSGFFVCMTITEKRLAANLNEILPR